MPALHEVLFEGTRGIVTAFLNKRKTLPPERSPVIAERGIQNPVAECTKAKKNRGRAAAAAHCSAAHYCYCTFSISKRTDVFGWCEASVRVNRSCPRFGQGDHRDIICLLASRAGYNGPRYSSHTAAVQQKSSCRQRVVRLANSQRPQIITNSLDTKSRWR